MTIYTTIRFYNQADAAKAAALFGGVELDCFHAGFEGGAEIAAAVDAAGIDYRDREESEVPNNYCGQRI